MDLRGIFYNRLIAAADFGRRRFQYAPRNCYAGCSSRGQRWENAMISSTRFLKASVIGLAGLVFASAGFANTGGMSGGGGMPSTSAPSFNPAAEYKKGLDALDANNFKDAA